MYFVYIVGLGICGEPGIWYDIMKAAWSENMGIENTTDGFRDDEN